MKSCWLSCVACAALLLLSACSPGYPDKAEIVPLHYRMAQSDAVKAMNQVGQHSSQQAPTRFALHDGCVLELSRPTNGQPARRFALKTSRTRTELPPGSDGYRVILQPDGPDGTEATVLDNLPWTDATQMKWLLDYVRSNC